MLKINILAITFKSLQTLLGANEINLKRAYIVKHKAVSLIGFHSSSAFTFSLRPTMGNQ